MRQGWPGQGEGLDPKIPEFPKERTVKNIPPMLNGSPTPSCPGVASKPSVSHRTDPGAFAAGP